MSVRCFMAVECDDEQVLSGFREVGARLSVTGADLKLVETENVHLALKFLGEIPEAHGIMVQPSTVYRLPSW
ncbi:MAG TPA: hypothetical protein VMW22_08305 [Candidatus Desulfaltia sp.]|nr:hypothetical protein [Candidatus Desulfaltia sp.]